MVNLPTEIWIAIGELAATVYGELETNFGEPFVAHLQFNIAVGVQKVIPTRRSLVLVSRVFHAAFTSLLYRSIVLKDDKSLRRLAEALKSQRSLDVSQRNGRWTRRLFLITRRARHWRDLQAIKTEDLLEDLPRLQILGIRGRLNQHWYFPFDLSRGCKELKVLHAPLFSVKLLDHIHSPTAFSDAFPTLCHIVVRDIQFVSSSHPGHGHTHFINPLDPSFRFLHCSNESVEPFLRYAHTFSSLTIIGLTVASTIKTRSILGEVIARGVTTLDFSGVSGEDLFEFHDVLQWVAARGACLETLVINFRIPQLDNGFPPFSSLRHLGLFATSSQTSRLNLTYIFNRIYKYRDSIFPRLENIRLLQSSFSSHIVQQLPDRVVKWTGHFSSKGVRLENYKGELLSSGIRSSVRILYSPVSVDCCIPV